MLYIPNHIAISSQYLYLAPPCTARLGVLTYWRYLSGQDLFIPLQYVPRKRRVQHRRVGGSRYLGNSGPHTGDHFRIAKPRSRHLCSPFSCQTTEQASPCDTTIKYMYYRPLTPSHSSSHSKLFHGIRATHSVVTVVAGGLVQVIFFTVCCAGEIRCIAVAGEEPSFGEE